MFLTKRKDGAFVPSDEESQTEAAKILPGGEVKASKARNAGFHRKAFALLNLGFSNQDKIEFFEVYRKVITIKAGYYDVVPTKNGEPYYIPRSLAYDQMSAVDFDKWYNDTLTIIGKELGTAPEDIQKELEQFY